MENEAVLLKVKHAARLLDRSASAVYEDLRRGTIPSVRIGNSLRIPRAAIDRMVSAALENPANELR
jgi:excisionase family DNA binding protein